MKITTEEKESYTIITIEGSLSNENLKEFEKVLDTYIAKGKHILIDFSKLTFIFSSGLSVLLSHYVASKEKDLIFVIYGMKNELIRLFEITEISRHMPVCDSLEEALSYINRK